MATPQIPNMNDATGILLADGWHVITALFVLSDPEWASTQGVPITLGPWFGFTDDHGVLFAFRYENALAFKWEQPPGPQVATVSPATGPAAGGDVVTVTGTGLAGATAVSFGGNAAGFTPGTDTSLTATSPAGTGTVDVTVTTPAGTSPAVAADEFTYT